MQYLHRSLILLAGIVLLSPLGRAAADDVDPETLITAEEKASAPAKKPSRTAFDSGTSFIAGPDWEYDGLISGGEGQSERTMFHQNDIVYLNIGYGQGLNIGRRLTVYRRGAKVRDPQTRKVLGYEVRRIGQLQITDQITEADSSARVVKSSEGLEIGDFVRLD